KHVVGQYANLQMQLADFFFSSRRRHTRWPRDWSSDVCSSDLGVILTIKLGEYYSVIVQPVMKFFCGIYSILTRHSINYKQYFRWVKLILKRFDLAHHFLIDCQASRCIYYQSVPEIQIGRASCRERMEVCSAEEC